MDGSSTVRGARGEATASGVLVGGTVDPVDATTVLLVRDGSASADGALEVLLMERHLDSDFAGGALVFPGGKVDDVDRGIADSRWRGASAAWWCERLGVTSESRAVGFLAAGVRETFEEAGVLLATRGDGSPVTDEDLSSPRFVEARRRLASRDEHWDWLRWLEDEDLVLDFDALGMWSWWVTPEGHHKRFDTRFLVARLPVGQTATYDDVELTSLRWSRPTDVLRASSRGECTVIFPTRRNLADLAAFDTVSQVRDAIDEDRVDRRRILPTVVHVDGRAMVQHPDGGEPQPI